MRRRRYREVRPFNVTGRNRVWNTSPMTQPVPAPAAFELKTVVPLRPHLWKVAAVSGLLAIGVGVAIVVWTGASITIAAVIFGIGLLLTGFQQLFFALTVRGAMCILLFVSAAAAVGLGIYALARLSNAWSLLAIWIAIGFIFRGVATTMSAIGDDKLPGRTWHIVIGVITLIAGVVVMASPYESLHIMAQVVGIWIIVIGVMEVVSAIGIRNATRSAPGGEPAPTTEPEVTPDTATS